ncbi:chemotaxis protein CheB [Erythrobacter insulae]|nr:chemotaxis protein CheB [Erythrobacter insulae]
MKTDFPIIGIGASAGGLDALKSFFDNVPEDMGAAFVVIQHLDPSHQSMTAEILDKHTKMPAKQIEHGATIEPNHVYVIPPNASLTIADNTFELGEAVRTHGVRMPIDMFFSSLASQREHGAVGLILSGTGSDGSAGIREIKGAGGITLAQTPETAQFDGMPSAAIATGMVDIVCPVEDMPAQIKDFLVHQHMRHEAGQDPDAILANDTESLTSIIALLQARIGHDFRGYKTGTLGRRILRRMGLRGIDSLSDYLSYLKDDAKEAEELYRDLLINVTSFFRDPAAFETLDTKVLAKMVAAKPDREPIRVWVPGCATGEEAYSIAMLLIEHCETAHKDCPIQVFATDIDEDALAVGRTGMYASNLLAHIPEERINRFFIKQDGSYLIRSGLRETVTFAEQNVISDPPFSKLDLVSCRNLLIYLQNTLQDKVIGYFHFALNDGGILFLGRSEGTSQLSGLFEPVDKTSRIFRKLATERSLGVNFPVNNLRTRGVNVGILPAGRPKETARIREIMQQQLLRNFAPAAVLTNAKHQVLYFMGPTSDFLEQPSGLPTQDLLSLAHPELRRELRTGLKNAIGSAGPVIINDVSLQHGSTHAKTRISIKPMAVSGETERLFLVTFEKVPTQKSPAGTPIPSSPIDQSAVSDLETKLRDAQEDLQISLEELESTNEELQASNQEMMSLNEELQSSNEELETSKEELQAMNEELSTVNNQLKNKVEELADVNDDLTNFVSSTGIATLLLDTKHQVGRFTPSIKRLFNLIDADIGRPIVDIRQKFEDANFLADVDAVSRASSPVEREIIGQDGALYLMRIAPYRAAEMRSGGVIVTFVDISRRVENERRLQASEARFRSLFENAPDPLLLVDQKGDIALTNSQAQQFFGYDRQALLTKRIEDLMPKRFRKRHVSHRSSYMENMSVRPMGSDLELWALLASGEEVPIEVGLSPVETESGAMVCVAIRDVREHQKAVRDVRDAKAETEAALAAKSRFLATASHDLRQPLQSLAMLTEALRSKVGDPDILDIVDEQRVSLANLRDLLNSLLDISKLEADAVTVELEDIDLDAAVAKVCASLEPEAEKKGIKLSRKIDARIVHSDIHLVQQILQNLIGNAIKFTDKGRVDVVSQIVSHEVLIEVRDEGPGIPADQLSHIFDEFYQVGRDPQQAGVGLGLGLAIANQAARMIGSQIDVQSEFGKGSTFSFTLPLSNVLLPKNELLEDERPAPLTSDCAILLVDDDPSVLKSTKFRLAARPNLKVFAASSPKEVDGLLAEMEPDAFDIIVTDYHLGTARNGLDIIENARKHAGQKIPAILISGDTGLDPAKMKNRAISVIFKPAGGNELIDTITRLLSR